MFAVKAPDQYWNEPDILFKSGPWIAAIGKKALIITGKTALRVVESSLIESLENSEVAYVIAEFSGSCTLEERELYSRKAIEHQAELVIGIGGGKALDLSKAVGDQLNLPVVTVPTVAATCAAWSALTVLYDDQGRSSGYLPLKQAPVLVLADTTIIAAAPKRYLAAGIGDTLVKWYETVVNIRNEASELDLRFSVQTAKLAFDVLHQHALEAYELAGNGEVTPAITETVDAIILLAGLVGSVVGTSPRIGIAHSLHDSLTQNLLTNNALHGERVAFGLLTQVVLENRPADEVEQLAGYLHRFKLPITLKELGIEQDIPKAALDIAKGSQLVERAPQGLPFTITEETISQAIQKANRIGHEIIQATLSKV